MTTSCEMEDKFMKKIQFLGLCVAILLALTGCASTDVEEGYVEMTMEEFQNADKKSLYYDKKIRNIIIKDFHDENARTLDNNNRGYRYSEKVKNYPNFKERIIRHKWEKEIPIFTVKGELDYYKANESWTFDIEDVENLRTKEEVEASKAPVLQRIEQVNQKYKELPEIYDKKGAELSKGYVYHGYNERERNVKLILNGALEKGNAYYIPDFEVDGSWAVFTVGHYADFTPKTKSIYIYFANQNLKASLVDTGIANVIVINDGKASNTPTVIGIVGKSFYNWEAEFFCSTEVADLLDNPYLLEILERLEKKYGITQE